MGYESPAYRVTLKDRAFECRLYEPFATAKVLESNLKGYSGFGYLFSYISGDNQEQQKMNMTVPVINDYEQEGMTMEFVVPKEFINRVPTPNQPEVKIKHYPSQLVAVYSFSGLTSLQHWQDAEQKLRSWLEKNNLKAKGQARFARYNSPYALPFMRHNEVQLVINDPQV
jgi:effector-binding domain-containing protein